MARSRRGYKRGSDREGVEKTKINRETLSKTLQLFQYVLPYKWLFIAGMIVLTLGSLLFLVVMRTPGEFFNIINGEPQYGLSLNQLFGVLLGLLAVQSLFSYLRVQFFAYVSEKSMADLRTDLYEKLVSLSIPFLEQRRVGELTSRMTSDITEVQSVVSVTLAEFLRQIIVLVGGIGFIIYTMPRLALIMLGTFPVVVVLAMFFGRFIRKLMRARQDQLAKTNVVVEETMQSIQTVKAYTNEWFEIQRYTKNLSESVRIALRAAHMRGLFAAFIILFMFGALFFIMWRAAILVQNDLMKEGDLLDFVVYTAIIGGAIASLGGLYTTIASAVGATERILDILEQEPEAEIIRESDVKTRRFEGNIHYQDVHFSYPSRPDMEILKGINFSISAGQKVALVGGSGAGKSTIVQLLLQFYEVSEGEILIDGQPVGAYDLMEYRRNMAIVPQEVLLFGGTIRENIQYGRPGATDEEIIDAAHKANAWDFIQSFPEGLDTMVGERGVKLSGGQRQRIAIARAILKDPAILLLDEATSSLDAESEKLVQDALNELMKGRTSIIIAHRLATIRDVDCIYVIENGKIIEQGTHTELSLVENGVYNALAKLQFDAIGES
jgi:ATP-binding cassette subfamily B protein